MKFAYMIMAHNEPYILNKLIQMLDYPENDIFLHIDAKASEIKKEQMKVKFAKLKMIESQNITWGGESQICAILDLMVEASKTKHDYYHFISGVDLPLKKHSEMLKFFEKNEGKEFIGITPEWTKIPAISDRYKLHWFFQDKIGKTKGIFYIMSRVITKLEKIIKYKRKKYENVDFYGGPTWFSLTESAIKYILDNKVWIKERFRHTICCDEIYAQTIIGNSKFKDNIYNLESNDSYAECLRYVEFDEESPFVLEIKDYEKIIHSGCIFARKFGTKSRKQRELVDRIFNEYDT